MGYDIQLTELHQRMEQRQKEHEDEVAKIKWEAEADSTAKNLQLDAYKRARDLAQQRLKLAEEQINEYMANPLVDPTTNYGKNEQIKKLQEELDQMKEMCTVMQDGYKYQIQQQNEEIQKLKKEVELFRARPVAQISPPTQSTPRAPLVPQAQPRVLEFEQMDIDPREPSTSEGPAQWEQIMEEQDIDPRAPPLTPAERQLRERMAEVTDQLAKDCMEWERRILHSACVTLLTPTALRAAYHMPSLPYPLLRYEVQFLKNTLLPQCPTNELGGYEQVPIRDYEVAEIERNQPLWRKGWFTKDPMHKLHYVNAPQELRIDPTFCPIKRRRDWETFSAMARGGRINWLNYPVLPSPDPGVKPTEAYVIRTCNMYINRLKGVPDLSCVMLRKICKMITTIITAFKDLSQAGPHWSTYFEGIDGLAWDLNDALPKRVLMGLYARCIFLPAHWLVTFEECFYTGFFEIESRIFSSQTQDLRARYVAFMTMEYEHPAREVLDEAERQRKMEQFRRALERT